ncbi:MAG: alpha/beta fold hydrolase [Pseudomonadota bacterium]
MTATPVKLHAKVDGDGPDMVLAHGLFGSAENLGGIARRLRAHFRVHALDMRNHGRSPHTATHTYTALSADIGRYLDDAALIDAHLVGHSMGGKAVMTLAQAAPTRVRTVSVIDIAPKPYPRHHDAILDALLSLRDHPPTTRQDADQRLATAVPDAHVRHFLLKNLVRTDAGPFALRVNIGTLSADYDAIAGWHTVTPPCPVPVSFIVGGASDYIQAGDRAAILAQFPNASSRVIPTGSHWVHAEKPELVAGVIARFAQSGTPG